MFGIILSIVCAVFTFIFGSMCINAYQLNGLQSAEFMELATACAITAAIAAFNLHNFISIKKVKLR